LLYKSCKWPMQYSLINKELGITCELSIKIINIYRSVKPEKNNEKVFSAKYYGLDAPQTSELQNRNLCFMSNFMYTSPCCPCTNPLSTSLNIMMVVARFVSALPIGPASYPVAICAWP
jgi:hypothetical protein